jgi:hypothetical protein
MANKINQTKTKRLSKSQRTHVRRVKQAAGKTTAARLQPTAALHPSTAPKQED